MLQWTCNGHFSLVSDIYSTVFDQVINVIAALIKALKKCRGHWLLIKMYNFNYILKYCKTLDNRATLGILVWMQKQLKVFHSLNINLNNIQYMYLKEYCYCTGSNREPYIWAQFETLIVTSHTLPHTIYLRLNSHIGTLKRNNIIFIWA